ATRDGKPRLPRWRWRTCSPGSTRRRGRRKIMARIESRGRSRALQALYAWDLRHGPDTGYALRGSAEMTSLAQVATLVWDDLAIAPEEREFAGKLLRILMADGPGIDAELAEVTTNWRIERLGAIERCVLRIAAAEFQQGGTPPRVVIHEAVRLAERYGSSSS